MFNNSEDFIAYWIRKYEYFKNKSIKDMYNLLLKMNVKCDDFNKYNGCIDLHIHTCASDGEFTNYDILFASSFLGLKAISITDHSTTCAYNEIILNDNDILVEPGTEIITIYQDDIYHILAYGKPVLSEMFQIRLKEIRDKWNKRFYDMLKKVNEKLQLNLCIKEFEKYLRNETFDLDDLISYIHDKYNFYSKVFLLETVFGNKKEIADSCYIESRKKKYLPNTLDIIDFIQGIGGYSVLAHTLVEENNDKLKQLVEAGLYGIELYHPYISAKNRNDIYTFAKDNNLRLFGGSDYHGSKKGRLLGKGVKDNQYKIPFAIYAKSIMKMDQVYAVLDGINAEKLSIEEKVAFIMKPNFNIFSFDPITIEYMKRQKKTYSKVNKDIINTDDKLLDFVKANINANMNPVILNINQEGGRLNTIDWDKNNLLSGNYIWGKIEDDDLVNKSFKCLAKELLNYGITWNLAPVADVLSSKTNTSVSTRSFGEDIIRVKKRVRDFVRTTQLNGVAATVKHFPGVGYVQSDGHLQIPMVEELLYEHLEPFIEAINSDVAAIMISNTIYKNVDDKNPALMSYEIVTKLLRNKLNYKGVIVTDNISMPVFRCNKHSLSDIAVKCFNAGADIILYDPDFSKESDGKISHLKKIESFNQTRQLIYNGLLKAVKNKTISMVKLDESVNRIIKFYEKYGVSDFNSIGKKAIEKIKKANSKNVNSCAIKGTKIIYNKNNCIPIDIEKNTVLFLIFDVINAGRANSEWKHQINVLKYGEYKNVVVFYISKAKDIRLIDFSKYNYIIFFTYNLLFYKEQQNIFKKIIGKGKVIIIATGDDSEFSYESNIYGYISASCRYDHTVKVALNILFKGEDKLLWK